MNFITKKSLPRRTMLKGLGAGIALPMLDAMLPALSAKTASAPPRLGFVYVSHGIIFPQWKPQQTGRNFELSPNLQPLAKIRDHVNVYTNLSHLEADTKGDGSGDHNRAAAAWLTGVHAYDRTRPGAEIKLAPSIDQIAARHLGRDTQVPSVEVTTDPPSQGACDSGDCFYVNTVSWRSETSPNAPELYPRVVFERLFGDGGSAEERRKRMRDSGSILDSVLEETGQISARLGSADSSKLDEYLGSIRDVEQRIQAAEAHTEESVALPDRPVGIPTTFEEHCNLMFDLQLAAFRADVTRVFSLIMARELSGRSYANIGVPGNHHLISHHREDPALMSQKARIDTYHVQLFAKFLEKMQATPDGDGSLLDHSLILYGSGMGNGNLHRHSDLPVLTAGKLNGKFQTGYHFDYKPDTHMANLLVSILDGVGVPTDKVGDSTGQLLLDYSRV
jgi:hypothetical protein